MIAHRGSAVSVATGDVVMRGVVPVNAAAPTRDSARTTLWIGLAAAGVLVAVGLLVRQDPRLWLVLGLIAGLGLEAKYTIAFLIVVFAASLILTRERRQLATVWPWMGLMIALLLLLPNVVWQVQHGWPSLHCFSSQNAKTASDTSRPAYVAEHLLFLGATTGLATIGAVWLWRHRLRALALIPVLVTLVFRLELRASLLDERRPPRPAPRRFIDRRVRLGVGCSSSDQRAGIRAGRDRKGAGDD